MKVPPGAVQDLPALVVAVDPDSRSSALAWAVRDGDVFKLVGLDGGGSRRVSWQSIAGQRAWLQATALRHGAIESCDVIVVCETQAPDGPQSRACEPLRRVRYHFEAACEVDGYDFTHVDATTWEQAFTRGEQIGKGPGARKAAYQRRAKTMSEHATNEDRCAALGILHWYVVDVLGCRLVCDRS